MATSDTIGVLILTDLPSEAASIRLLTQEVLICHLDLPVDIGCCFVRLARGLHLLERMVVVLQHGRTTIWGYLRIHGVLLLQ